MSINKNSGNTCRVSSREKKLIIVSKPLQVYAKNRENQTFDKFGSNRTAAVEIVLIVNEYRKLELV